MNHSERKKLDVAVLSAVRCGLRYSEAIQDCIARGLYRDSRSRALESGRSVGFFRLVEHYVNQSLQRLSRKGMIEYQETIRGWKTKDS